MEGVRGSVLSTLIPDRPVPLGTAGHAATVAVSDTREPVENEDVVTFTATFKNGAVGTFSVSRIAYGLPNSLGFEVFCEGGAAVFDLNRAAEFTIADGFPGAGQRLPASSSACPPLSHMVCPWTSPASATGKRPVRVPGTGVP